MREEIGALEKGSSWEFTKSSKGEKVTGCQRVFTNKHRSNG